MTFLRGSICPSCLTFISGSSYDSLVFIPNLNVIITVIVTAITDAKVWALPRTVFQAIMMRTGMEMRNARIDFLRRYKYAPRLESIYSLFSFILNLLFHFFCWEFHYFLMLGRGAPNLKIVGIKLPFEVNNYIVELSTLIWNNLFNSSEDNSQLYYTILYYTWTIIIYFSVPFLQKLNRDEICKIADVLEVVSAYSWMKGQILKTC